MKSVQNALVVLSGGQDSTTCLYWALQKFSDVQAITFNYGQRHSCEIDAAMKIAQMAGVEHEIVSVPGILTSTSPLTSERPLELYSGYEEMEQVIGDRVELTFVPMRNVLFLTVAINRAVAMNCRNIVTGICQEDNANYPDCTEEFREAMENAVNQALGTSRGLRRFNIHAPLMNLTKAQSIHLARKLPGCWQALSYSHTSYEGEFPPVSMNHANVLRARGFEEAGLPDPLVVRAFNLKLMALPPTANYNCIRAD